jgi:CHAT domain-containing protein/lipopolysaccharide biosynthesis regulator YciM
VGADRQGAESNTLPARAEAQVLEVGQPIEKEVAGDQSHLYRVTLAPGQYMDVSVELLGIAPVTSRLLGPEGERLIDSEGRTSVSWIAEKAGDHRLEIAAIAPDMPPARYAVKLTAVREATADDRRRIVAGRLFREAEDLAKGTEASRRKAIDKYEESRALWHATGDAPKEAHALLWMGEVHHSLGEMTEALELYERALVLAQSAHDRWGEGTALHDIGAVHTFRHEWEKSLEYYARVLDVLRASGNRIDEVPTRNNLAAVYQSLGEPQRALDTYLEVLRLVRQQHNRYGEAVVLNSIGRVYASLGEDQRGIEYYSQALPVHRLAEDQDGEAMALLGLGRAYFNLDERGKALETIDRALDLVRRLGNRRFESYALRELARIHYDQGQPRQALEEAQQAASLSLAVSDRGGQAEGLHQSGLCFAALGDAEKALEHLGQALALLQESGDRREQVRTLYELGRVERDRGRLPEARRHVEDALRLVESLRTKVASPALRASYFALVQKHYELYIDLLMRLHRDDPGAGLDVMAFESSERARARSLLELLGEARADIREGVDRQLLDEETRIRRRLSAKTDFQMRLLSGPPRPVEAAEVAREIEALTAQLDQIEVRIRQKSPRYAALTQPRPLSLREVQEEILDADTVLLEYALGEERSFLWAVTTTSFTSHGLPGRREIDTLARRAQEAVSGRPRPSSSSPPDQRPRDAERELAALGRVVLGPAQEALKAKRLLIVAPDALQYVPFAALSMEEAGVPLVADHEIVTLPSASVLALLRRDRRERRPPTKTLAVFADPVFEKDDERVGRPRVGAPRTAPPTAPVDPGHERSVIRAAREAGLSPGSMRLPFTGREAKAILALVPPEKRKEALGFAASRTAATSPDLADYRFVHFATHGFVNGQRPELSGVVLSLVDPSGQEQDGFLSAADIFNLRLSAELVVLSGCRTGLGKDVRGEGLVGLTRAFMYAGAGEVVASLWNVDDAATAELMRRFYQEMLGPRRSSPAAALRAAQRGVWGSQRWRAPYYWSGFVIQGDWK